MNNPQFVSRAQVGFDALEKTRPIGRSDLGNKPNRYSGGFISVPANYQKTRVRAIFRWARLAKLPRQFAPLSLSVGQFIRCGCDEAGSDGKTERDQCEPRNHFESSA